MSQDQKQVHQKRQPRCTESLVSHRYQVRNKVYWDVLVERETIDTLYLMLYTIRPEAQAIRYYQLLMALEVFVLLKYRDQIQHKYVEILRGVMLPANWDVEEWRVQVDSNVIPLMDATYDAYIQAEREYAQGGKNQPPPSYAVDQQQIINIIDFCFYEFMRKHRGIIKIPIGRKKRNEVALFMMILSYQKDFLQYWIAQAKKTAAEDAVAAERGEIIKSSGIRVADEYGLAKFIEITTESSISIRDLCGMMLCGTSMYAPETGDMPEWTPHGKDEIGYRRRVACKKAQTYDGSGQATDSTRKKRTVQIYEHDSPLVTKRKQHRLGAYDPRRVTSIPKYTAPSGTGAVDPNVLSGIQEAEFEESVNSAVSLDMFVDCIYRQYPKEVACTPQTVEVVQEILNQEILRDQEMWKGLVKRTTR